MVTPESIHCSSSESTVLSLIWESSYHGCFVAITVETDLVEQRKSMKSLDYISDIFTSSKSERNLPNARRIPKNNTPQVIICLESGNVLINNTHTSPVQRTVTPVTPISSDASSDGRSPSPVQEKMHPALREPLSSIPGTSEERKAQSSSGCSVELKTKRYVELPGSFSFDAPDAATSTVETSKTAKSGLGLTELDGGSWQEWRSPSRNGSITTTVSDGDGSQVVKPSFEDPRPPNEVWNSKIFPIQLLTVCLPGDCFSDIY